LKESRETNWLLGMIYFPYNLEREVESVMYTSWEQIHEKVVEIQYHLNYFDFEEDGPFRPWETFKALVGIYSKSHNEREIAERRVNSQAPDFPDELKNQLVLPGQFYEMWSKVLELLSGRLAPIQDLRKALCFGDLTKRCCGCLIDFTVEKVSCIPGQMPGPDSTTPTYSFDRLGYFSFCGRCDYKVVIERVFEAEAQLMKVLDTFFKSSDRCDGCGEWGEKRHRCITCHTKLYCSRECHFADQDVHQQFCKPKEEMEPWKIIREFKERKDAKKNMMAVKEKFREESNARFKNKFL